MSQATSNKHTTGSADEGCVSSCTHNQTSMQVQINEDEEKLLAHPSATHCSPAMRLYRHALESILGMLTLEDLSRFLAVSREWSAAVRSMKPIDAVLEREFKWSLGGGSACPPLPPVQSIITSPLLRHLAAILISGVAAPWTPLDNASVALLAHHAPNLISLWCKLQFTPNEPLIVPAKLTGETSKVWADEGTGELLLRLQTLSKLSLIYERAAAHVDFLAQCRSSPRSL